MSSVAITFDWRYLGSLGVDARGLLMFPRVGQASGIYQFVVDYSADHRAVYIGEAAQLDRRWQRYRTPGSAPTTNLRLGPLLSAAISTGGTVGLHIATTISLMINDLPVEADLSWKPHRLLAESAALSEARDAGIPVLNL
jgi:hypothetical protein